MKKLLILLAVCSSGYAMAQNTSGNSWGTNKSSADEANHFIKKAAKIDMVEIKAGKMAQEKSMNSGVKSYGEMIVKDHTMSHSELKAIAGRRNIQLPAMDHSATANAGMGTSSSSYMGASSYLSGDAANTWVGTERSSRIAGTSNMRLSKAQTTPSTRYRNGQSTGWTDKHIVAGHQAHSNWTSDAGASNSDAMSATGENLSSSNSNWSAASPTPTPSGTMNTNEEPGVSSSGNLGVSGTTGTLTTNAAFNGATMGTDNLSDAGTASTTQSIATGTNEVTATQSMDGEWELSTIDNEHSQKLDMLRAKSGAEFDREYINMMSTDHSKAIQLYEKASMSNDAEIKAFASKMLPILKQHQDAAKNLMNSVGTANAGL